MHFHALVFLHGGVVATEHWILASERADSLPAHLLAEHVPHLFELLESVLVIFLDLFFVKLVKAVDVRFLLLLGCTVNKTDLFLQFSVQ
jgi:hypothetical protein